MTLYTIGTNTCPIARELHARPHGLGCNKASAGVSTWRLFCICSHLSQSILHQQEWFRSTPTSSPFGRQGCLNRSMHPLRGQASFPRRPCTRSSPQTHRASWTAGFSFFPRPQSSRHPPTRVCPRPSMAITTTWLRTSPPTDSDQALPINPRFLPL